MSEIGKRKEFKYKGRSEEEMKAMDLNEYSKIAGTRIRRSIKRGLTDEQKKLLKKVKDLAEGKRKKPVKTHARNMPIVPEMLGTQIHVYDGKTFRPIDITTERLGHFLGEFATTRKKVSHKAPGVGATRSSKSQSVK